MPSPVDVVRTDDAAEFKVGAFADLCPRTRYQTRVHHCKHGIALIESAGKAAAIQASIMFPSKGVPSGDSLWAAQAHWACHALNSTATSSNPQCKTPYEMWYGKVPPSPFPFLKPGFVTRKRGDKLEPKAVPCYYIGLSSNRPRDSMRVMLRSGVMIDSRDVTWASVPPPSHVVAPKSGVPGVNWFYHDYL